MNKYEILGVSGEGAYGVVLKCRNKETGEIGNFINNFFCFFIYVKIIKYFNLQSCHQKVQRD
jgi:hypothetical protein